MALSSFRFYYIWFYSNNNMDNKTNKSTHLRPNSLMPSNDTPVMTMLRGLLFNHCS